MLQLFLFSINEVFCGLNITRFNIAESQHYVVMRDVDGQEVEKTENIHKRKVNHKHRHT